MYLLANYKDNETNLKSDIIYVVRIELLKNQLHTATRKIHLQDQWVNKANGNKLITKLKKCVTPLWESANAQKLTIAKFKSLNNLKSDAINRLEQKFNRFPILFQQVVSRKRKRKN